ncbi:MAG: sterol desaturase family protein [Gammaproteobacteria bacterium]|nr:sterol desaturase family protein [Gammaproteobacteria bacterium]
MTLPTIILISITALFLILERVYPGRQLPNSTGWYIRAITINLIQLGITLLTGKLWLTWFGNASLLNLSTLNMPIAEGLIGWITGTFVFYWWHRLRHKDDFWLIFHQIHHSASRIEILTSFYKHPVEIFTNSFLTAIILFPLLGVSLFASFWYNLFAATGEYFYHANIKTPTWLRYFIQTPELHSIHHQYDVHKYNFSDLPIWDRLFGTYMDTTSFTERCGFPDNAEQKLAEMLIFKDVYQRQPENQ